MATTVNFSDSQPFVIALMIAFLNDRKRVKTPINPYEYQECHSATSAERSTKMLVSKRRPKKKLESIMVGQVWPVLLQHSLYSAVQMTVDTDGRPLRPTDTTCRGGPSRRVMTL